MATRTIVTSQPDVACDVCERRLLRGEQHDTFIAAGRRLTVCELCAPRAAHEGWLRETDMPPVSLPPPRGRRGRTLLDRLRQVGRPVPAQAGDGEEPYEFLEERTLPVPASRRRRSPAARTGAAEAAARGDEGPQALAEDGAAEQQPPSYLEQAVTIFNGSEFPRRVAGVARSLGSPEVSVRSAEHLESVVRIVVAWELSWYRYEVDLSDGGSEARVLGQGTELAELAREERLANAVTDDSGRLALTGA